MLHQNAPIVLIHGLFGNLQDKRILSAFGGRSVHAPELIGYGEYRQVDVSGLSLSDQADHVLRYINNLDVEKIHLVGHSVGGAVSAHVCQLRPDLIASYTSVEGNFTLKDAFWTGALAVMEEAEVAAIMNGYCADPGEWFSSAGVARTPWTTALAKGWLDNQPATTIQAQAKAVVTATSSDNYLLGIKEVLTSGIPIYLIAGEKTAVGWDVPDWVNAGCTIRINIPGTGHFMMAEDPELFARSVLTGLSYSKAA